MPLATIPNTGSSGLGTQELALGPGVARPASEGVWAMARPPSGAPGISSPGNSRPSFPGELRGHVTPSPRSAQGPHSALCTRVFCPPPGWRSRTGLYVFHCGEGTFSWVSQPPQGSRCVLWGGGGAVTDSSNIRTQGGLKGAPPTSLQIRKLRQESGGDHAPTSEFNSWFPVNIFWVVSSPRSRCEGEAVPGRTPGIRLQPHRSTPVSYTHLRAHET